MVGKLAVVAAGMFGFGYALVPMYKHICEVTGINILALAEKQVPAAAARGAGQHAGRQSAAPSRWSSTPTRAGRGTSSRPCVRWRCIRASSHGDVRVPERAEPPHVGAGDPELRAAQAAPYFNKVECFCFNQYTLEPGENEAVAGGFRDRPEAVQGRQDDHAVVHLLRGRRQDPAGPGGRRVARPCRTGAASEPSRHRKLLADRQGGAVVVHRHPQEQRLQEDLAAS